MKCPQCQKEIPDTALFCTQCGIKLSDQLKNSESTLEEEVGDSFGCGGDAFSDSEFVPSPFGNSPQSYECSYTSYTSYGTGDGWDPYSQILHKKEGSEKETEEKTCENEIAEESNETENSEAVSDEEVPEEEKIDEKNSEESPEPEDKDQEKLKSVEMIGLSSNDLKEQSGEYTGESFYKKKRKFPLLFLLIMAAVVYIGYQKGGSDDQTGSDLLQAVLGQKSENTNVEMKEKSQENSGEIQEKSNEESYDMTQEDAGEEEIVVIYSPTPEIENTEELFPVSVEEEFNMGDGDSTVDSVENAMANSESQERMAFLVEYKEGSMDSSKRVEIISAEATSTIVQEKTTNEPILMFDNKRDTNWQEGVEGSGIGQSFTATFKDSSKVRYITFLLGNWKTDEYYYGNNRPKKITLELNDFKTQIDFPDVWEEFCVEISPACEASSLKITLDEVYAGTSWDDTVITDINLYRE